MQGSFLFYSLSWAVNPPQHTTVSQRQICSSQSALPFRLAAACVRAASTASRNGAGRASSILLRSKIHTGVPRQPQIHPRLQPMCWLAGGGNYRTLWPFPCWTGETPSINPGPAGADRGQTLLRSKQAGRAKSIVAATQELQIQNRSKTK